MPLLSYIPALKDKRITKDEKEGCPQIKVLMVCFKKRDELGLSVG